MRCAYSAACAGITLSTDPATTPAPKVLRMSRRVIEFDIVSSVTFHAVRHPRCLIDVTKMKIRVPALYQGTASAVPMGTSRDPPSGAGVQPQRLKPALSRPGAA